jgi:hypothetical protein
MRTVLFSVVLTLVGGCHGSREAEGPMERAGKHVDNAAEKTGHALGTAAEKTGEATKKAAHATGEAFEKVGKKLQGDDARAPASSAPATKKPQ